MGKSRITLYCLFMIFYLLFSSGINLCSANQPTTAVELSADELQYMQTKKSWKVSVISNEPPFSYTTRISSRQGLPLMILERFAAASNTALEFVPAENYSQSLAQLKAKEVDFIAMMTEYPLEKSGSYGDETLKIVPYLTAQSMLVYHKNTILKTMPYVVLADVKGRYAFTKNQNISLIYYETPADCLNAVRCGQADMAICDSFTAAAKMPHYGAKDLIAMPTTIMMRFGFGLLPEADSRLVAALQKTIATFPSGDITRGLLLSSDYTADGWQEFVYRYPFEIICFELAIMFVVALSLLTYTKVNIRQHQALQGYEESYRMLADTFGEAGIEYDYQSDRLTIFGKHSNLDIAATVDHCKEKLADTSIRLSLTAAQWEQIISDGAQNKSFVTEFQCGVKSGEWVWYRLIYTVICTTESHRRPIRLVGCLVNIDAEHAEKERLLKLSSNDPLTGLFNRRTAEKHIRALLEQEAGSRTGMLAILDIDYFKNFNDQLGHLCGDDVLRSLGRAVRESFADEDILCRWGGDEFMFFLVDEKNHSEGYAARIESLRKKMSAYQYQHTSYPVTLTIGGAKSYPHCTFDILFQQADDALYLAKKNGRDQFWLYAPTKQKHAAHAKGEE